MADSLLFNSHHLDFIRSANLSDEKDMEVLYDQYSPVLYGIIYRLTNNENKSEEILLKTFKYISNNYNKNVTVQNICLWMVGIARKFCFETLKKEELLKAKDNWQLLLLERGGGQELEILGYAFFQGMTIQKMAVEFNCTEFFIRKQLHEAVNHLKKEYLLK